MKYLSAFFSLAVGLQSFCCSADPSGKLQPLVASVHQTITSAVQPEYYAIVYAGTNQFTFSLPEGFRLGGEPGQGKLNMFNIDMGGAFITFTVSSVDSDNAVNQDSLAQRYPAGKVVGKFDRPVLGRTCQVTDIAWWSGNIAQKTRVLFIPSSAGLIEITFSSGAQQFNREVVEMNRFLNSLRLNSSERRDLIRPRSFN